MKTRILPDPQKEIIERYCREARKLLEEAQTKDEALSIRERVCAQLAQECDSPLILDATQTYVDHVIQEMWQKAARQEAT